jgi:hypothetical protein
MRAHRRSMLLLAYEVAAYASAGIVLAWATGRVMGWW